MNPDRRLRFGVEIGSVDDALGGVKAEVFEDQRCVLEKRFHDGLHMKQHTVDDPGKQTRRLRLPVKQELAGFESLTRSLATWRIGYAADCNPALNRFDSGRRL